MKLPSESQALTVKLCAPVVRAAEPDRVALVLETFLVPSTYTAIAVTVCELSRAAALNCTGEATVELFAGAQIATVLSVEGGLQEPGGGGGLPLPTVIVLRADTNVAPAESHALTVIPCEPALIVTDAEKFAPWPAVVLAPSTYSAIEVTLAAVSLAAAVTCTGEVTEAPFAGEQITTVLSTVAAQVCA